MAASARPNQSRVDRNVPARSADKAGNYRAVWDNQEDTNLRFAPLSNKTQDHR
jgi:hypothetical protein